MEINGNKTKKSRLFARLPRCLSHPTPTITPPSPTPMCFASCPSGCPLRSNALWRCTLPLSSLDHEVTVYVSTSFFFSFSLFSFLSVLLFSQALLIFRRSFLIDLSFSCPEHSARFCDRPICLPFSIGVAN